MYEVLLTREEASRAVDLGDFFRSHDNRDLNYGKYLEQGSIKISLDEYSSNNTKILSIKEIKDKLLKINYIKEELNRWEGEI